MGKSFHGRRLLRFAGIFSVVACATLAGCSSQSTTSASSPAVSTADSAGAAASAPAVSANASAAAPVGGTIVGTWSTGKTYTSPTQPFVTFAADGTWKGSDGCNQVHGTWKEPAPGTLVVTSGPHTLMACEGAPIPTAVAQATSYTIEGGKLTLSDKAGKQLTVLVPAAAPAAGSSSSAPISG